MDDFTFFLNLNESKTEIIVFGSSEIPNILYLNSGVLSLSVNLCVKNKKHGCLI